MNYDAKYQPMENSVENLYNAAKSLDGYVQRLGNVKSQLGLFTSLLGFRDSVGSRATAVSQAAVSAIRTGQCLDNVRMEYTLSEQIAYQLISGDTSFNIGDGVKPVGVPELKGVVESKAWWEKVWEGIVNVGKAAIKVVTETWAAFQDKIKPGGDWYEAWQWVKTGGKILAGTLAILSGNPLGIIYGANKLMGAGYDLVMCITGNYDEVDGFNPLKTVLQETGGYVGGMFGYEELGRMIGGGVYYLGEVVLMFSKLDSLGGFSGIKDIMSLPVNSNLVYNLDIATKFLGYSNGSVRWFYDLYRLGYSSYEKIVDFRNPVEALAY